MNDTLIAIWATFCVAVVVGSAIWLVAIIYNYKKKKAAKTIDTEVFAMDIVKQLPSDSYCVIPRVKFVHNNVEIYVEILIASIYGIFLIQTRDYPGEITGKKEDAVWNRKVGTESLFLPNPLKMMEEQAKALGEYLGVPEEAFVSMVVFSQRTSLLVTAKNQAVYNYQVWNAIHEYQKVVLEIEALDRIEKKLKEMK